MLFFIFIEKEGIKPDRRGDENCLGDVFHCNNTMASSECCILYRHIYTYIYIRTVEGVLRELLETCAIKSPLLTENTLDKKTCILSEDVIFSTQQLKMSFQQPPKV